MISREKLEAAIKFMRKGDIPCTRGDNQAWGENVPCLLCGHDDAGAGNCPHPNLNRDWCEAYLRAREQ